MASPSTPILDSFTGANGTTLPSHDATWAATTNSCDIQSNTCRGVTTSAGSRAMWQVSYGPDSDVYLTLTTAATTTDWVGLWLRMSTAVNTTMQGYAAFIDFDFYAAGQDRLRLYKVTTGPVFTALGSDVNIGNWATTQQFWLNVGGSNFTGYIAGTSVATWSDSVFAGAGYIGLEMGNASAATIRTDDFGGGTVVVGAVPNRPLRFYNKIRRPGRLS